MKPLSIRRTKRAASTGSAGTRAGLSLLRRLDLADRTGQPLTKLKKKRRR